MIRLLAWLLAPVALLSAWLAPGLAAPAAAADGLAIVIANQDYAGAIPDDPDAIRDARLFRRYLLDRVGFALENVVLLENAGRAQMVETLGTADAPAPALRDRIRAGQSAVLVYFAGHGVPARLTGDAYLLPVDGSPEDGPQTGYAVSDLYQSLLALKPRSLVVVLDASFGADTSSGALMQAPASVSEAALIPPRGAPVTLLTATQSDEIANVDQLTNLGLFTRYFLMGMEGAADAQRFGNQDGQVTLAEMDSWLKEEMGFAARRDYGRSQRPTVIGNPNAVLARRAGASWPPRATADQIRVLADTLERAGRGEDGAPAPRPSPAAAVTIEEEPSALLPATPAADVAPAAPAPAAAAPATPTLTADMTLQAAEPDTDATATAAVTMAALTEGDPGSEQAIGLDRNRRVQIQAALRRLGYEVGEIDGSFGPRTRDALVRWQKANGLGGSGFLDAGQLARLTGGGATP